MRTEELHKTPGHLVRRVHQISLARFSQNMQGCDLTSVQYAALVAIGSQPGLDATRVAEAIAVDKATIGGVLERLVAKNFVVRRACPEDRRVKTLNLSKAGQGALKDAALCAMKAQADMLAPLNVAERKQFVGLLTKLIRLHSAEALKP
jgi:DNA-binding MarR family transcriptional regulator